MPRVPAEALVLAKLIASWARIQRPLHCRSVGNSTKLNDWTFVAAGLSGSGLSTRVPTCKKDVFYSEWGQSIYT